MKKIIIICFCILINACSKPTTSTTALIVGTNAVYPPYTYIEQQQIVGFDLDIIKTIAHQLNKKIIIKDLGFDALIPALQQHNIDLIAAGLSPTVERAKQVLFTQPYLLGDPLVIVMLKNKNYQNLSELKNINIAVNEGYTADLMLTKQNFTNLLRLPDPVDAFLALTTNHCEVFVTAQSTYTDFISKNNNHHKFKANIIEQSEETYAFAIAKDNLVLYQEIQNALKDLQANGTLAQIKTKWNLK